MAAPIYPAASLLTWLEANRSDPTTLDEVTLRLPVFVTLTANTMDVETAKVGDRPDALAIALDDRTLNIPLAGKLPMLFGEGTNRGMVWLRGLWRGGQDKQFQVTMVEAAIGDASAAVSAEIVK